VKPTQRRWLGFWATSSIGATLLLLQWGRWRPDEQVPVDQAARHPLAADGSQLDHVLPRLKRRVRQLIVERDEERS
jgi:hypothetical protein